MDVPPPGKRVAKGAGGRTFHRAIRCGVFAAGLGSLAPQQARMPAATRREPHDRAADRRAPPRRRKRCRAPLATAVQDTRGTTPTPGAHARFQIVEALQEPERGARTALSARTRDLELADKAVRAPYSEVQSVKFHLGRVEGRSESSSENRDSVAKRAGGRTFHRAIRCGVFAAGLGSPALQQARMPAATRREPRAGRFGGTPLRAPNSCSSPREARWFWLKSPLPNPLPARAGRGSFAEGESVVRGKRIPLPQPTG